MTLSDFATAGDAAANASAPIKARRQRYERPAYIDSPPKILFVVVPYTYIAFPATQITMR
jgi:hypothetical protein